MGVLKGVVALSSFTSAPSRAFAPEKFLNPYILLYMLCALDVCC